ncbi:MAG: hypothetical protein IH934_00630 [Nanoarchaeota archaeon]|nr:hypothetical protein [Nanoarchaeota archaeon]
MRKFLFITIFVLFLYAMSVNAVPNFKFSDDFVNLSSVVSNTISSSVTIDNTGTTALDINFTGFILTHTDGTNKLTISSLSNITNPSIAAGASQSASFSVVIPSGQTLGTYTGTLTAANGSLSDPATISDTTIINVNVTPTFSVSTSPSSELNLGSASLDSTQKGTFDITNTGTGDITNLIFGFSDSKFSLQTNKSNFTLSIGETKPIGFNITIPKDTSTGNVTLGKVRLTSAEFNTDLFDLKAEISGGLIIDDLDVFLTTRIKRGSDGTLRSESGNDLGVPDGKKLNFGGEDAGPGSELRFSFNIVNTFTDDEDIDINDITIKVTIEELDDGDDLEEESKEFDVDAGGNVDIDVFFNIPISVVQDTYDVVIELEGEDENRNTHSAKMNLKLRIDKESREVMVSKASLFPEKIKCSGSSTLTATIKNIGARTEADAKIEIINSDLGINFVKRNIKLEEDPFDTDNEFTKKLTINIDRGMEAKKYPIEVKAYIQEEILWETRTANLEVEACAGQVVEEVVEEEIVGETEVVETAPEIEEETTEGEEISVLQPTTTTEVPLVKKRGFWIAVVIINIILIAGAAFLVARTVRKKQL